MATATNFKHLGVQIPDEGFWDLHVDSIAPDASQRFDMIKRILFDTPKRIKKFPMLHFANLMYNMHACEIWNPYLGRHIHQIEMKKRRAVSFISNLGGME